MFNDPKDAERVKAVIDLHTYIASLGNDRPPLGAFLKELGISPQVMQDAVIQTSIAVGAAIPPAAFELVNHILKLGVTIGYKYAIKKGMEDTFDMTEDTPEDDE